MNERNESETRPTDCEGRMIIRLDDLVVEFASNLSLGMRAIVAAAETYVMAITKYPTKARDEFARRFPRIRKDTWQILEDVGRGRLPPESMMMLPGAVEKLRNAKIPKTRLAGVVNSTVSVYNPSSGSYVDVPFTHMTAAQADIVLNPVAHSLRTERQQKRYVEAECSVAVHRKVNSPDFTYDGDGIIVKRLTRLSLGDLRAIVGRLESEA